MLKRIGKMKIKVNPFIVWIFVISLLILFSHGWGACPEQPNDGGVCDSLYVEVYPWDVFFTNPGQLVRVLIKVTHDNPSTLDSIAGIVIPFSFTHTNPAKYCSLSYYWNNSSNYSNPRNIFRHLAANGDTVHNWMMDQYSKGNGEEWNLVDLQLNGTANFWLAMMAFSQEDPYFGEGRKVLIATLTFKVEDTMTICLDTCFWPPSNHLKFIRSDALAFVPRHQLPYCFSIRPWNAPRVELTLPVKDQLNVPVATQISVTFDTTMDATSINPSTFIVTARSTGRHPGTISYNNLNKTATFDPLTDFKAGEMVTAVLTADILALDGTPMKQSHVWSFTAAASRGSGNLALNSTLPVGDDPLCVFAADLDNDGDLDLAVANSSSDNVSVLLNNGGGVFSPDSTYPVGISPGSITAADLDIDGNLDLIVANSNSNNVSILSNLGNGTFTPHIDYPVGSRPYSVVSADLDGDGDIDLAGANAESYDVSILLNNGNAVFAPQARYPVADYPTCICSGDLDKDGDIDLVISNNLTDQVAVLMNHGNGTFAPYTYFPAGIGPFSAITADVNGNGYLDIIVGHGDPVASSNISVLLNNCDGTFSPPSVYTVGNSPLNISAADMDADGDLDLLTSNAGDNNVSYLSNHGNGSFSYNEVFPVGNFPVALFATDLDGNGSLDLVAVNRNSDDLSILLSFIRGDVNGDGLIDIGDMVYLLNYLYKRGPAAYPPASADANCDEAVNVGDVIYLINYLFRGGPLPFC
jgi:hypothetical protein